MALDYVLERRLVGVHWHTSKRVITAWFNTLEQAKKWMNTDIYDVKSKWPELGNPILKDNGVTALGGRTFGIRYKLKEKKHGRNKVRK